jgi:hypothetical protein
MSRSFVVSSPIRAYMKAWAQLDNLCIIYKVKAWITSPWIYINYKLKKELKGLYKGEGLLGIEELCSVVKRDKFEQY